jgi:hypothetical protein
MKFFKASHQPVGGYPEYQTVVSTVSVSFACNSNMLRNWNTGHQGKSRIYLKPMLVVLVVLVV